MPRYKMSGRASGGPMTLTTKIKDLKKQINHLKIQLKKSKQEAYEDAYRKAMADMLREIEKRDAARDKVVSVAKAKFEKAYDNALARKAKIKRTKGTSTSRRGRPPKDAGSTSSASMGMKRRGRPRKANEEANNAHSS